MGCLGYVWVSPACVINLGAVPEAELILPIAVEHKQGLVSSGV